MPERAKSRRRHICEPLLNDAFDKTRTIHFASKKARHRTFAKMRGAEKMKGVFGVRLDLARLEANATAMHKNAVRCQLRRAFVAVFALIRYSHG